MMRCTLMRFVCLMSAEKKSAGLNSLGKRTQYTCYSYSS
jgi:hypothetical protein